MEDQSLSVLILYPNPAVEKITAKFPVELGLPSAVEILDDMGRIIQMKSVDTGIGISTFDVGELAKGHYNLRVSFGNAMQTLQQGFVKI